MHRTVWAKMSEKPNANAVRMAKHGDNQAFARLVEDNYAAVYGLAFSAAGNWRAA